MTVMQIYTSGWQVGSDVDNNADDGNDNAGCGGTDCDNCDNRIAATVAPTVNKDNINLNKFTNKVSREKSNMNTWILLKCMIYGRKTIISKIDFTTVQII